MTAVAWFFICVIVPNTAEAYIDPGSGALALQALIAGLLGFLFTIRQRLGGMLQRLRKKPPAAPDAPATEADAKARK